jgi:hypothetical protein
LFRRANCCGFAGILLAATQLGCSDPTAPHSDVDRARRVWLASNVTDYTFEVATATSWFPKSGYYHVSVAGRLVESATDPQGRPLATFTLTVDEIWDRLLAARESGELNSVLFNRQGVPIETDFGPWEVDGGVRYSVRNFVRAR